MKSKVHYVVLRLQFDKPCTVKHALKEFRNEVQHGTYYCTAIGKSDPETFRIAGVRRAKYS